MTARFTVASENLKVPTLFNSFYLYAFTAYNPT